MTKFTWTAGAAAMLLAFAVAVPQTTLGEGAEVYQAWLEDNGTEAFVPGVDADGNRDIALGTLSTDMIRVSNARGIHMVIHAEVVNETGTAHQSSGFPALVSFPGEDQVITDDTFLRVSASGQAVLKATYTAPDDDD